MTFGDFNEILTLESRPSNKNAGCNNHTGWKFPQTYIINVQDVICLCRLEYFKNQWLENQVGWKISKKLISVLDVTMQVGIFRRMIRMCCTSIICT